MVATPQQGLAEKARSHPAAPAPTAVLSAIFVCCAGDWDQGEARSAARPGEEDGEGGASGDEEGAEVFGDFEDLETGGQASPGVGCTCCTLRALRVLRLGVAVQRMWPSGRLGMGVWCAGAAPHPPCAAAGMALPLQASALRAAATPPPVPQQPPSRPAPRRSLRSSGGPRRRLSTQNTIRVSLWLFG